MTRKQGQLANNPYELNGFSPFLLIPPTQGPRHQSVATPFTRITSIRQIAALPYRVDEEGIVEVLLITSRATRRWVVPKGNLIDGLTAHAAAAREAFEEAGVIGTASRKPIGSFEYFKLRSSGRSRRAIVKLFALSVSGQADVWPEKGERESRWFSLSEAAEAVFEPDLKALIGAFEKPSHTMAHS